MSAIRYIFPTIRIVGRIVQMYADLKFAIGILKVDDKTE